MPRVTKRQRLKDAVDFARQHPSVHSVYEGFRHKDGKRTDERCLVFVVKVKRKKADVSPLQMIPKEFEGSRTDVVGVSEYKALSFVTDVRPQCPGGYSSGSFRISAGTHGAPCFRGPTDERKTLSNNHVYAASNQGLVGDHILQRGDADGGSDPMQWWTTLESYVAINFPDTSGPPTIPDCPIANFFERSVNAVIKNLTNSRTRIEAFNLDRRAHEIVAREIINQPSPNLVDAAVARPRPDTDPVGEGIHILGLIAGVRDVSLGERVQKVGRTTEHTKGRVVGVNGFVNVNYGPAGTAEFEDQLIIEADSGDFSAGGDSGSAILTMDNFIVGLLFAGGGGQTIANKISHVQALLGVRF